MEPESNYRLIEEISQTINDGLFLPYCKLCKKCILKSVISLLALATHVQVHLWDKQYESGICCKTSNQASNLKRHKYVHTGKTPYARVTYR